MDYTEQLNEIIFLLSAISGFLGIILGLFAFYMFAFGLKR